MAPRKPRKKSSTPKPKPQAVEAQAANPPGPLAGEPSTEREPAPAEVSQSTPATPPAKSWLGGTWPRNSKTAPVAQIARESISSAGSSVADAATSIKSTKHSPKAARSPSLSLTKSAGSANRAALADTSISKINVTSNESRHSTSHDDGPEPPSSSTPNAKSTSVQRVLTSPNGTATGGGQKIADNIEADNNTQTTGKKEVVLSSSWLGWFSKQPVAEPVEYKGSEGPKQPAPEPAVKTDSEEPQKPKISDNPSSASTPQPEPQSSAAEPSSAQHLDVSEPPKGPQQSRSWLQLWATPNQSPTTVDQDGKTHTATTSDVPVTSDAGPASRPSTPANADQAKTESLVAKGEATPSRPPNVSRTSGWVFWSRDRGTDKDPKPGEATPAQEGELAVSDTPSQVRPESAVVDEAKGVPNASKAGKDSKPAPAKRKPEDRCAPPLTPQKLPPEPAAQDKGKESTTTSLAAASKQLQKAVPNILLPSFRDTFEHQETPNFLQQIAQFLGYLKSPETRHVSIMRNPAPVRRALAIGVHGFFPATLIRSVLGQPTGTSIKFSNMAAKAIRKWAEAKGISCQVEKVALEGEGRIAERVELLWKLLLNWIDDIRKADFILIACHSQGVPVAIMLVAKLILFGCSPSRIGLCCMAGVSQGPFVEYKSRFISGSAGELFEFSNPNSKVSQEYTAALEICLRFGVKIVYAGSIDDQLVSLESSTFTAVIHPHIYRAVFVDGRVHAPSFLSHLVGFALKLRNLGVPDHGLIRELSSPLAGSIYSGEGHSRIYEDETVYDLAVEYALETTSVGEISPHIQDSRGTVTPNPYILPFAMRGLLEEEYVRKELHAETSELLRQFDDWKPTTKALKDVKFRLEGIRSKL